MTEILKVMFSSNASLLLIEVGVYLFVAALAVILPLARFHWVAVVEDRLTKLGRRRALSVLTVIGFVLIVRGALIPVLPTPVPGVHDEYSYLLAGDTFASARVTNAPHPLWKSLETFYVIQHPTYASMYPPAQGLALAIGYLAGNPWIGVYLSVALMCGAICWMLQAWVPPQWALMGGIITALRLGIFSYWMESYWGGAVAALGGALVVGAMPRLIRKRSIGPAVVLGIGLLILANSRPFEGLLFVVSALGMFLFIQMRRGATNFSLLFKRVALPLASLLFVGTAAMTYYFWRVTGNPLRMPYQIHSALYEVTDPFLWQPLRPTPTFRYVVMEKYHVERQTAAYVQAHSLRGWLFETWRKAESLVVFYFWPAVLPAVIALPLLRRSNKVRFALVVVFILFVGLTLEIWPMTQHYHAPVTALMILLLIQAMRYWRVVEWRGMPVGLAISRTIPVFCAGLLAVRLGAAILHIPVPEHGLAPWFTVVPGNVDRAKVQHYLEAQPGSQLVLVRYNGDHHVDEEWVHNEADIDGSKVVWARDGSIEDNAELLTYFRQRRVWLLEADQKPPRLTPLPTEFSSLRH